MKTRSIRFAFLPTVPTAGIAPAAELVRHTHGGGIRVVVPAKPVLVLREVQP